MMAGNGCGNDNASLDVFLVEDHPIMHEMLIEFLEVTPGFDVCGSAESAEKAIELLKEAEPDLILVDFRRRSKMTDMVAPATPPAVRFVRPLMLATARIASAGVT